MARKPNKSTSTWPKITQGTHLTVKEFEDGRTELVWDDDQLLKEIQAATAAGTQPPTTKKKTKKKT